MAELAAEQEEAALRAAREKFDSAVGRWVDVEGMPPIASLRKQYKPLDFLSQKGRSEVSSLSDMPGHGAMFIKPATKSKKLADRVVTSQSAPQLPRGAKVGAKGAVARPAVEATRIDATESGAPGGERDRQYRRVPWWPGQAPSNRSEASSVTYKLDKALAAQKNDFRAAMVAHNAAFEEVTKQVGVHCAERGELCSRLQAFYTRQLEVTARLAERSIRDKLEGRVASVEAENERLRRELERTRAKLEAYDQQRDSAALIASIFATLGEAQRAQVLRELVATSGELLLATTTTATRASAGGGGSAAAAAAAAAETPAGEPLALPLGEQLATLSRVCKLLPPAERASTIAAFAARQEHAQAVAILRQMLAATPAERLAPLVLSVLDEKQRRALMVGAYNATADTGKPHALAELLSDGSTQESMEDLAEALLHSFSDTRTMFVELMRNLAKLDAEKTAHLVCAEGLHALTLHGSKHALAAKGEAAHPSGAHASGAQVGSEARAAGHAHATAAATAFAARLEAAEAQGVAVELLRAMPLPSLIGAELQLLRRCDEAERIAVLHALLGALHAEHGGAAELQLAMQPSLPKVDAAALVGAMASVGDLFTTPAAVTKLALGVMESGEGGGFGVAALYRALPAGAARQACLRELTSTDAFAHDEMAVLMEHVRQVIPMSLKRYVNAWHPKHGTVAASSMVAPSISKMKSSRGGALAKKGKKGGGGGGLSASHARGLGLGGDDGPQVIPLDNSLRLVADIYSKKVREDALSDAKGKPRMPITKFVQNYMLRQYGMKGVADKAMRDLAYSVRHFVEAHQQQHEGGELGGDAAPAAAAPAAAAPASAALAKLKHAEKMEADVMRMERAGSSRHEGGGGGGHHALHASIMPRIQMFGGMMGMLELVEPWPDAKVNFFFSLLSACVLADVPPALSRRVSSQTRSSSVGGGSTDGGGSLGGSNAPLPQASDAQAAAMLKEAFLKEELLVSVAGVSKALEALVRDGRLRKSLLEHVRRGAVEVAVQPGGRAAVPMVSIDDVLAHVLGAWQDSEERRVERYSDALGQLFDATDDNQNGLLDYGEFRRLLGGGGGGAGAGAGAEADAEQEGMTEERMLDLFDNAIQLTSELEGDLCDSVSRDAFVHVATEYTQLRVRVPSESAFYDPVRLAAERLGEVQKSQMRQAAGRGAARAKRTIINPSDSKKDEAKARAERAEKVQKSSYITTLIKAAVRSNFLFRHLDDAMLDEVVGYMTPAPVKAGDVVIRQGDKGDYFYVCERGSYDVLVDEKKVHTYTISTAQSKYPCFGELALMYAKPRAATVVANEDGMLWRLGRGGFRTVQSAIGGTDVTKVLRNVAVFSSLGVAHLQQLRDHMKMATFEDGECVFRQNDPGDAFYVISRGHAVAVKRDTPDAPERELMQLHESMYFGERALLNNDTRAATVRAVGKLQCAYITRPEFEGLLGSLEALLQEDRKKREKAEATRQRALEQFGLAHATLASFTHDALVAQHACGATYLATHNTTSKQYTLRAEAKGALASASEQARVTREVGVLRALRDAELQGCSSLPCLLHTFQSDAALVCLFSRHAVCELTTLLESRLRQPFGGESHSLGGKANAHTLGEAQLVFVAACVVQALDHLHDELQVLHRNLVPESLLVHEDGYVCLHDMRFAKRDDGSCRTLCGSPAYFAPETVRGEAQSAAADWWALGILLYELGCGGSPWGDTGDDMTLLKRISAHAPGALHLGEAVSPSLSELLDELLQPERALRRGGGGRGGATAAGGAGAAAGGAGAAAAAAAGATKGGEPVRTHPWLAEVNWARMWEGAEPSPLLQFAQDQLHLRVSEGPGDPITSKPYAPPEGVDTSWMDVF